MAKITNSKTKGVLAAKLAIEKKGENVILLDIRKITTIADYMLVLSCTSTKHTQGIAAFIKESFENKKIKLLSIEGFNEGSWILLDYGDIIIHIFDQPLREFYQIENLWKDGKQVKLDKII